MLSLKFMKVEIKCCVLQTQNEYFDFYEWNILRFEATMIVKHYSWVVLAISRYDSAYLYKETEFNAN